MGEGSEAAPPEGPRSEGIASRTLRGMAWAYGSYVGGRLLVLVATGILARLLTPEDFGLVALAITFMALLDGVADFGLGNALVIQKDEELYERAESVFAGSVAVGALLCALIAALSPLAADFFDEPGLGPIAAVLGLNVFLRTLGSTHYALAQRSLDFRARTTAEFADVLVRGATGIGLALAGFGAWALVGGYLIGTVTLVISIWLLVPWRPRFKPRLSHLREMAGYGSATSGLGVVASLISNIDYVFVGRVLGATALGFYSLAFRLPELLVLNLSMVAGAVLFPAFSAVDREELSRAFLIALRFTLMVSLPITVGLVILAEPFVLTAFGGQWTASIVPMQILAVYAFAVTVGVPAGTVYKATGRAGVLLGLAVLRLALVATFLAIFIDRGFTAVAVVQAGVACAAELVALGMASRLLGARPREIAAAAMPALAGGLAVAPPLLAIEAFVDPDWLALACGAIAGGLAYVAAIAIVTPDTLRYLRERALPRRPPPEPRGDPTVPSGPDDLA